MLIPGLSIIRSEHYCLPFCPGIGGKVRDLNEHRGAECFSRRGHLNYSRSQSLSLHERWREWQRGELLVPAVYPGWLLDSCWWDDNPHAPVSVPSHGSSPGMHQETH